MKFYTGTDSLTLSRTTSIKNVKGANGYERSYSRHLRKHDRREAKEQIMQDLNDLKVFDEVQSKFDFVQNKLDDESACIMRENQRHEEELEEERRGYWRDRWHSDYDDETYFAYFMDHDFQY